MVETVPGALQSAARKFGNAAAIVDGKETLSFRELRDAAVSVARSLVAAGVRPGDRVALWAPNSARWAATSFGIYMSGAVLVPLNTRFRSEEAAYIVRASGTRLLITVEEFLGQHFAALASGWTEVPSLEEVATLDDWNGFLARGAAVSQESVSERCAGLNESSTSDIIFTSGTTGAPKGAVLTHGASVRTYGIWSQSAGLRRGDRYLCVYPFFHTSGLKSVILTCLLTGATVYPFAVFDVDAVMECVAKERITVLPGPPTAFQSILSHPDFASFDISSLRMSVTGAAVVPVEVIRRMRDELRFETVLTGYGLTETTGTVSICHHDDPPELVATTVGRPLPGVEVKVVDDAGATLPADQPGELMVRGFNVMKEYFNDAEATSRAIDPEGWLRTGDIGYVGSEGNIRITDRKKDMYICGGFNVYPAEIEGVILRHPAVAQVAVIGVPDERMGEVGQAVVVTKAGERLDSDEFLAWCKERMANYKAPRAVRVVDALPLNPSGKVMKFKLREEARSA
jgi:acyl-CoA synthetase (AMP-forming)/AMP-acid ligase II